MNISSGLPSGSTTADYNRLVSTKVEFIKVNELPTSYMKSYPYIYILLDGSKALGMYEYNENSKSWIRYSSDSGIKPITQAEYDRLSDEEKNNGTFYLITDRLVYDKDVSLMIGATSNTDGRSGMVPLPIHGDPNRSLRSDGSWKLPDSELSTTSTNSLQNKTATTELNKKAPLESPVLTGTPQAPTASVGTNNTQIANTSFVQTSVSNHNSSNTSHSDIRNLISELTKRFNALANSDDVTLDQLSEIVAYIKSNKSLIDSITTSKVNVVDIVNNLTSTATNKPLSAAQGKVLKGLVDGKAPTNHSHNYAGSSSAGGSSNSAVKLDTATAGSATQPVYFSGGKPTACTYTLGKSVPSDAKFTDTNTWRGIQNNLTSDSTSDSLSAAQGKVLNNKITNITNESLGVGNVTISADGNTFTQTFSDGRVTTLTKTDTGFREIRKDASGNVISDITTTVSDNGTITSTKTS